MSETMVKKQLGSSEIQTGVCRFCGQIYQFETDGRATEGQLDRWAQEKCDCNDAMIEKKRKEKEEEAKKNIKELAGEDKNEAVEVICIGIDFLITGKIAGVEVVTKDGCKLSAKINSKNTIKTEMTKIMKKSKEA